MHDILLALISGGIGAGILGFMQFLVSHFTESKTHRVERVENVSNLRKELKQGTDENSKAIEELRQAVLALTDDADERRKYEKAMGESLMALTHDRLVHLGRQYQQRGGITLAEQTNLTMLYTPYHDGLGGNHDGEIWYNYCMNELEVITEQRAIELDSKIGGQVYEV